MRIAKFKVSEYRSISNSASFDLRQMSVLVGPNNEGKSNILRALVVGVQAIQEASKERTLSTRRMASSMQYRMNDFQSYHWERDYPLVLQETKKDSKSKFEFEFELNERDMAQLKRSTGHNLNDSLKVRVLLGRDGYVEVKIVKQGPANAAINENVKKNLPIHSKTSAD